jgi:hypothetical protein
MEEKEWRRRDRLYDILIRSTEPRSACEVESMKATLLAWIGCVLFASALLAVGPPPPVRPAVTADSSFTDLAAQYDREIRPVLARYCVRCHSAKRHEADVNLAAFTSLTEVRKATRTWQKVLEMLDTGQMPPQEARALGESERARLSGWVRDYLKTEARALAGDPGPVVLRRLNNAELTWTIRDLTGVYLQPARLFPPDGAAGEGFTNTGASLVMSPSLLARYLEAAKEIAAHVVLLPDGIRFSPSTTRRDWTNEILARIRETYRQYSDSQGGMRVNLQGIVFKTNDGGRLPLERYLAATLSEREALMSGKKSIQTVAHERKLNARYLETLWSLLTKKEPSVLLDHVRTRWSNAKLADAGALAVEIGQWQNALTRFQSVGHMKSWMTPITPLTSRQEIRQKVPTPAPGNDVVLYLAASTAGDGPDNDFVLWQQPRLVIPGRADLHLRDVREFTLAMSAWRERLFASTEKCLAAAGEAASTKTNIDTAVLARRHGVTEDALSVWLNYLGIGTVATPKLNYFTNKLNTVGGYDFVKGWGRPETPSLVANSTDRHVRIPGNMKRHGVCVHPSPTLNAAVGWRSPVAGKVQLTGKITHAHPECGNGIEWFLELRRGATRQRLGAGFCQGKRDATLGPIKLDVQKGDLISVLIGPRDGNHACDLTDVEMVLHRDGAGGQEWSLTRDVSGDVLAGNPHADRFGNKDVWHFYSEPVKETGSGMIPTGSSLARWLTAQQPAEKQMYAVAVQKLLTEGPPANPRHPDAVLYHHLASLGGPLLAKVQPKNIGASPRTEVKSPPGVDRVLFGKHPNGSSVEATSLCVKAPAVIEFRLPADLFAGAEFVATGMLHRPTGVEGSVQLRVLTTKPDALTTLRIDAPVLVSDGSAARKCWERDFDEFRKWFPAALCYTKIVPVDEVVTLTLFHREDEPFCRLMLDAKEKTNLDRLWEELHFVSHDALTLVDAFNQLMEYATQDGDPKLFEPFRKPILDSAAAFRKALVDAEPRHVEAVIDFAGRAYRRPLSDAEKQEVRGLYLKLRAQAVPHNDAIRLTLARVLVSPAFLYRLENAPGGAKQTPVSPWELASRLSYFLWSSMPDKELLEVAANGSLGNDEVLLARARRMLADERSRRLATEFGCQWLHISGFDKLDEKSERHFPTFVRLRGDMYEESIRFFTDLFQRDGSVLDILDADHTFLNKELAKHYAIPGVAGSQWRRVDGVKKFGRGGILGMSTTLAKQSGASRTSPILRGNWVSEVLLGEKLPRPPKDVPRLPEDEADTKRSVRQLVERHSADPRCAVCHQRIDAFGFALEGFDAIGRRREKDLGNRRIDTSAKLKDGTTFDGLEGLRGYLVGKRKNDFLRQFCRKLLGYALGRGVQLSDEPLLDDMQYRLEKNGHRFSIAVETIVRSRQFREIRGRDAARSDDH